MTAAVSSGRSVDGRPGASMPDPVAATYAAALAVRQVVRFGECRAAPGSDESEHVGIP